MAPMRSAFFLGSGSVLVKPANVAGLGPLQWLERG
jgi:hypothetical protein